MLVGSVDAITESEVRKPLDGLAGQVIDAQGVGECGVDDFAERADGKFDTANLGVTRQRIRFERPLFAAGGVSL